jgi:hypothetical protein
MMLFEIICDQFKQKRVEFLPNLNTVLGDCNRQVLLNTFC